jgi:MFS family permease
MVSEELLRSPLLLLEERTTNSSNLSPQQEERSNEQQEQEVLMTDTLEEEIMMGHNPLHQNDHHMADTATSIPSYATSMKQRRLATTLYLLTTSLLFADQNLMSPNLSAIAQEFGFDDNTRDKKLGGDIAIAFFMVGVPASFVVGCLADVIHKRSLLFLWVILIGEGACFATYYITTYAQLYWCRALTGMSVGGALPLIYSVLGDYYEPKDRGWVSGAISMGCGIGISFGQGAAGILGPRFGWRSPFLVVSVTAIICAIAVWIFIPEVERGMSERIRNKHQQLEIGGEDDEVVPNRQQQLGENGLDESEVEMAESFNNDRSMRRQSHSRTTLVASDSPTKGLYVQQFDNDSIPSSSQGLSSKGGYLSKLYRDQIHPHFRTTKTLLRCPSVLLGIFQGAPGCVPWGIVNTFLNDYLSSDRGLPVEGATLIILLFGLGNFLGTIKGGVGSSYLYTRYGPRYPALLSGGAAIAGCLPMWGLINYNFDSINGEMNNNNTNGDGDDYFANGGTSPITWRTYFIPGIIAIVAGSMSGITGPIVKSTLQNVTMPQMRGQAFALLNTFDDFGRGLGPAFVAWMIENLGGRTRAFNIGVTGWILCGILNTMLFCTVERDEEKVRLGVEQLAAERQESESGDWDENNDGRENLEFS